MNRIILLLLMIGFSSSKIFSQCTETSEPRVLIVGDSWAWFMYTESSLNFALTKWGHSNYTQVSNSTLAVNGAQTPDVMKATCEAEILHQLTINPTIDVVHLSIGGNDFLGNWNVSMTQGQIDTLTAGVFANLDSIIRFIQSCKPGIKILWSGYTYTNFKQIITDYGIQTGSQTSHPYYNTWSGMGFPDFIQINTLQNSISAQFQTYCSTHPGVYFVDASGYMQYVYGQTTAMDVAPTGTYAPYSVPLPHGDPNYPSPAVAMRNLLIATDCFHLSTDGFREFLGYHTQKFYQKFLMDDLYLLSDSTQTGTVSSLGNVSDSLFIGESGGENFATVLSFNTTMMADTTLKRASIFLGRNSLAGTNPISGSIEVKVKSGSFGATVNVEPADYAATADATGNPCLFGSNANNGDWVRLDLPVSILTHINHSAITQFIIDAPGVTGAKANFYNASDPDFAPVLNLAYGQTPSGINEITTNEFSIYPNPSNGLLTIENGAETITHIEVSNLLGAVVLNPQMQQHTIDISSLAQGMYILNITTKNGRISQKVVKE